VGDNDFELNIPLFLGLHPMFNVALIRPYFPQLLDTSEITEQLTPTELNLDYMQQASKDQIVDTHVTLPPWPYIPLCWENATVQNNIILILN
jgi:hypothetical protein